MSSKLYIIILPMTVISVKFDPEVTFIVPHDLVVVAEFVDVGVDLVAIDGNQLV